MGRLVLLTLLEVENLTKMLAVIVWFYCACLPVVYARMTCRHPHLPVVVEVVDLSVLELVQQRSVELAEKEALRHHPPAD